MDGLRQTAELVDATVFENEPRPSHQVADCFRYECFTRAGCCRNPRRDVNCDAADLLPFQVNLADMDTATHGYPERRDRVADCRRAANRARRTVEDADKAVPAVSDFPAAKSLDLVACRIVV